MTSAGWLQIVFFAAIIGLLTRPLGGYLARVYAGERTLLRPLLGPIEAALYRLAGVKPEVEQSWLEYAISLLFFHAAGIIALYALLRLQSFLPLNPQDLMGVSPDLALNTAVSFVTNEPGLAGPANAGPHGYSEILYAYTSAAATNGSAFAGLSANSQFYNLTLALGMFIGRFFVIVPVLAVAGSLAAQPVIPRSNGTLPTDRALFVCFLLGVIVIVGGLTYLPALALGPIVEHLRLLSGVLY
jgi:K+-transporting ATPase A subunit